MQIFNTLKNVFFNQNELPRSKISAANAWFSRGIICCQNSDFTNSIINFSEAIRHDASYVYSYINRGFAYQATGEHIQAINDFSYAIELQPNVALSYYNRGISYKINLEYKLALKDQLKAIELDVKDARFFGEVGAVYDILGEFDLALVSLTQAIFLNKNDPEYLKSRGQLQFNRGKFESSLVDLQKSLSIKYEPYAFLFYYLTCKRTGVDLVTELMPKKHYIRWPHPIIRFYLDELDCKAALAEAGLPRERGEAHFYIGQWRLIKGDHTGAIRDLKLAVQECPSNFTEHRSAIAELNRLDRIFSRPQ